MNMGGNSYGWNAFKANSDENREHISNSPGNLSQNLSSVIQSKKCSGNIFFYSCDFHQRKQLDMLVY